MKTDSLMILACPWSSLPMMLKLVSVMLCPVCCMCAWMEECCLRCSLHLSPRVLAVSPMYFSLQATYLVALETIYGATFLFFWVLVLRLHENLFYGCVAFEVYLYPILTTDVLKTFCYSFCIWYNYLPHCGFGS